MISRARKHHNVCPTWLISYTFLEMGHLITLSTLNPPCPLPRFLQVPCSSTPWRWLDLWNELLVKVQSTVVPCFSSPGTLSSISLHLLPPKQLPGPATGRLGRLPTEHAVRVLWQETAHWLAQKASEGRRGCWGPTGQRVEDGEGGKSDSGWLKLLGSCWI